MNDPLKDLSNLTDALYQAELGKMRAVNAREASLRHDLAELENLRRNNMTLPQTELHTVRQIGADVLWEGWVSRTRADLNTQLAQVLAQKARMTAELRRAFGKQIAAGELLKEATDTKKQNREKRKRQVQDDLQLISSQKP
ncbi:hypothetical protein [uncultured Roseovarius sp.]|uniref:hypothetical protein n=1 Tax=uncultured Roseovarius sp. TaxID=293344 RepID=UPI00260B08A0|nr:hypothetical protein [uncultured Roseovarius sp.]